MRKKYANITIDKKEKKMEEKKNVTVFKSKEEVKKAIESGESKQIFIIDLSEIDNLMVFYGNMFSPKYSETEFNKQNFPNLEELIYINPRGRISRNTFYNSAIKKAKICCRYVGNYAFCQSSDLEYIDLTGTEEIALNAFDKTKIRELMLPDSCIYFDVSGYWPKNIDKINLPVERKGNIPVLKNPRFRFDCETQLNQGMIISKMGYEGYLDFIACDPYFYYVMPISKETPISKEYLDRVKRTGIAYFKNRSEDESILKDFAKSDYENLIKFKKKYSEDLGMVAPKEAIRQSLEDFSKSI